MSAILSCPCCGGAFGIQPEDVGGSVVCPNSRQIVVVDPTRVRYEPLPTPTRARRVPLGWMLGLVAGLLLATLGGFWWMSRPAAPVEVAVVPGGNVGRLESDAANPGTPLPLAAASTPASTEPAAPAAAPTARMPDPMRYQVTPFPTAEPASTTTNHPTKTTSTNATNSTTNTTKVPAPNPGPAVPVGNPPQETPRPTLTPEPQPMMPRTGPGSRPESQGEGPGDVTKDASTTPPGKEPSELVEPAKPAPSPVEAIQPRVLNFRIDTRTSAELEQELLAVREVSLDRPGETIHAQMLVAEAQLRANARLPYPGPAILGALRPDLATLPYRLGTLSILPRDPAENLNALSKQFREGLLKCRTNQDSRPDPELVANWLLSPKGQATWQQAAAVPCLRQMLPGELASIRRLACAVYSRTPSPEATEALVAAAVFDTDFETRNAAVFALKQRPPGEVVPWLLKHLEHPWLRAVEHALEALVALEAKEATPQLALALQRPHPSEPTIVSLGASGLKVRREMVKINHNRNCLLCHAPSLQATDLVRASIPDPTRPLGFAAYYSSSQNFIRADISFLRQDFSVVQPVANPGPWPGYQRYDYLVATRQAAAQESPADDRGRHSALMQALVRLHGSDLGSAPNAWAELQPESPPPAASLQGPLAQTLTIAKRPDPLLWLYYAEFDRALFDLNPDEVSSVWTLFRRRFQEPGRLALWAYLARLLERNSLNATQREAMLALLTKVQDSAAWGQAITDAEYRQTADALRGKNTMIRRLAGELIADDPESKARLQELLIMLRSEDVELRRLAAETLAKFQFVEEPVYVALAKLARDEQPFLRQLALKALQGQPILPPAASEELLRSWLLVQAWPNAADQQTFLQQVFQLLLPKAADSPQWLPQLLAAARGKNPTQTPADSIAKLLGTLRRVPLDQLPDIVELLDHKTYGSPAREIVMSLPQASVNPLLAALDAPRGSLRAAAATTLGQLGGLTRKNGIDQDQRRSIQDALVRMTTQERDPEAKAAATAALKKLNQ